VRGLKVTHIVENHGLSLYARGWFFFKFSYLSKSKKWAFWSKAFNQTNAVAVVVVLTLASFSISGALANGVE